MYAVELLHNRKQIINIIYMKQALNMAEKVLLLSFIFTLLLLAARAVYYHSHMYMFYPWNLLLAAVPVFFSRRLTKINTVNLKSIAFFMGWLLFFPNAPYLLTDVLHFRQRAGIPLWYDLLLVLSAAWAGLAACFTSLLQVEAFITRLTGKKPGAAVIAVLLFATSSGIYLGRFLRYNSWDVFVKPLRLTGLAAQYILVPFNHIKAWAFSAICTALLLLIYNTIKALPLLFTTGQTANNVE